jgi:hypothetical protein
MNLCTARAVGVAAVLLGLLVPTAAAQSPVYAEGGYADKRSVVAGGTIAFHISTSTAPFTVQLINLARPNTVLQTLSNLSSTARDCTGSVANPVNPTWQTGCGWPVTTQYNVPADWPPGYYAARFQTSRGLRHIMFVVKPVTLGSYAPIVFIQTTNTYTAYNQFGGKSVYDALSTNGQRAHIVSFNRPFHDDAGLSRFRTWEQPFVDFMTSEGRRFEVITDDDMEAQVSLAAYKAVVIIGHSEYWTLRARQHLEAFSRAGGHIAVFGGNTMWWQSRVNLQGRQMTVYKDPTLDPMLGVQNEVVTTNFYDWPVFNPENLILGASFRNAGYANKKPDPSFEPLPASARTPYTVRNPSSWVFSGTGVTLGSQIAQASAGIEVDGAVFNTLPSGQLVVDGSDGTPLNYDILATLPASEGYGTIGVYTNPQGGTVFNAATRDWSLGLPGDVVVQQMTRNVLDRFVNGPPFVYQARTTPNRVEDLFNTPPSAPGVLPGWKRNMMDMNLSSQCAREGPTGLQLTGVMWTQILRGFAVRPQGLSQASVNVWLNADGLQQTPNFATQIVELLNVQGGTESHHASLEIQILPEGRSIRLSTYRTGGGRSSTTPWVVLTPGWHSVRMSWQSPGTVELNVSGRRVTAFNPDSGQTVNEIMVEFAGSSNGAVGSVCIDELLLRDTFAPASAATSTITAAPTAIPANGTSTSTITVQLKDAAGNNIINGGDTVALSTTRGTLSAVTDLGDGRYEATLRSTTSGGIATVSATVNGLSMGATASVTFVATATSLALTAPESAISGDPFSVTVTVRDAFGNPTFGYTGTVRFTSNSSSATLPADYTFQASENGVHIFPGVIFRSVGVRTITVTAVANSSLTASAGVYVRGRTTTTLTSSANPTRLGAPVTFTANVATTALGGTISGNVTFKDGAVVLGTAPVTGNVATFATSALAEGSHTITATYGGDDFFLSSVSSAVTQTVIGPPSTSTSTITASPPTITANGTSTALVEVQLRDASGNGLMTGGDTVVLTTTAGSLSPVTDNGAGAYTATLTSSTKAEMATITATVNGQQLASTATVTFTAATAMALTVTAPENATAGTPFTITVTARDANNNIATSYRGRVHFTSSDTAATLPADYTFQAGDNGTHQFSVTLRMAGGRTVTVTDVANPSLAGSATVTVAASTLPAPSSIDAVTVNTSRVSISWSAVQNAASYSLERSFNGGPFAQIASVTGTSHQDQGLAQGTSYLYRVRAVDPASAGGNYSAVDVATTIQFVDDPSRIIRAAHFTQLRSAIDAFRRSAGLAPAAYTNNVAPGMPVRAIDLTEMRSAANAARAAVGLPPYPFQTVTAGATPIRILHLHELQLAIGAIPGG